MAARITGLALALLFMACGSESNGPVFTGDDTGSTDADATGAGDTGDDTDATSPPDTRDTNDDTDTGESEEDAATRAFFEERFCPAQAEWLCAHQAGCGCPVEESLEACKAEVLANCAWRMEMIFGEQASLQLLPDQADRCVAAMNSAVLDCGVAVDTPVAMACSGALVLPVAAGAACDMDRTPCDQGRGMCLDGTCEPMLEDGASCELDEDTWRPVCRAGSNCIAGLCRPWPSALDEACEEDEHCGARLRCVGQRCRPTAGEGEACDAAQPCRGALDCVDGTCRAGTPEACEYPGDSGVCGVESLCGAPQRLVCDPQRAVGERCLSPDHCQEGAFCDPDTERCAAFPGEGEPCGDGVFCAGGLACSLDTELCAPIPGEGERCAMTETGPWRCQDGLACLEGTCGAMPGEGEPCGYDLTCGAGLGCAFEGAENRCRERRGVGGACDTDSICQDGTFCDLTLNTCQTSYTQGTSCRMGNECGTGLVCLPGSAGTMLCSPLPDAGQDCIFDCTAGNACIYDIGEFECFPEVCSSF